MREKTIEKEEHTVLIRHKIKIDGNAGEESLKGFRRHQLSFTLAAHAGTFQVPFCRLFSSSHHYIRASGVQEGSTEGGGSRRHDHGARLGSIWSGQRWWRRPHLLVALVDGVGRGCRSRMEGVSERNRAGDASRRHGPLCHA